jgi:hypothetical protein
VIREHRRQTVNEISEVRISKSLCHTILTKKLEMHHVAAKFVPSLFIDEHKANHIMVSQELFYHSNADKTFGKMS